MRGSGHTPDRRSGPQRLRPRVLIYCGGKRSEPAYFAGIKALLGERGKSVNIEIKKCKDAPDALVRRAARYAAENPGFFDQVWVVCDVDHFEREGSKVTAAMQAARGADIGVAASNPCFEFWLVLHHADCGAAFGNCDAVAERLRKHVPAYDKTKVRFDDFADGVADAIERAKKLDPTGIDHKINPSTGVWVLVEKLMEQEQ